MKFQILDLFSGVGGLSLGFRDEGFDVLLANEIDKDISRAYQKNHPQTIMLETDISKLDIKETFSSYKNKIDGIIGGPPCQGFSQKGQRKTIIDDRNYLFKNFFNVVEFLRPTFLLMENVPNLLTAESGYFKDEIINLFSAIGYSISCVILKSSDYGIPQNRRRAFIFGILDNKPLDIPEPNNNKTTIWEAISDLAFLNSGEGQFEQEYLYGPQSKYQEKLRNGSALLYNHHATDHSLITLERLSMIPPNGGKEYLPKKHITKSIYSGTWSRMRKNDFSVTITTRFDTPSSGEFTHPALNRAITVREAARIQSFPDTYIFYGPKSSKMKQVGNAVPPLLAKQIAHSIKNQI